MRFKYKEMKNQLEQRSSDLAETKKKIKFTKITEMEVKIIILVKIDRKNYVPRRMW